MKRKIASCVLQLALAAAIRIENFKFDPPVIEVAAGSEVTWTNADEEIHALAADDGSFHSKAIDDQETFSHVFATPGTYAYRCTLHPHMTGKIVVH
jgi:plastocyanin